MALPLRVTLGQAAHDELDRRCQTTRDATTRTRCQMILLRAEGYQVVEVARLARTSPDTVRRVLKRYLAQGPGAVPHRPHLGQPPHWPPAWEAELARAAGLGPHEVGVDSALWTCRLLAGCLAGVTGHRAGVETVRIALHRAGYVCKRPRWVLTRKATSQPGWARNVWGWRHCLGLPHHRCPHPPPAWSPMPRRPPACSPRTCLACWACWRARTCACKTRSRSPCTPP